MTKSPPWRSTPVTVGLAAAAVVAVATIAYVGWRAPGEVSKQCEGKVKGHEDRDVDLAHPGLPRRYVTREELGKEVSDFKVEMSKVKTIQQTILREVRTMNRRRRRRNNP
jgi:hypothetical protein